MANRTYVPCTPANCGEVFPKCGSNSTYRNYKCRCDSCAAAHSAAGRRYREANRGKVAEGKKRYAKENAEKVAEYKHNWHVANREHVAEINRRYRAEHRETIREKKRRYHAENSAAGVERARQWALANRERDRENRRRLALENPERHRENARRGQQRRRARMREVQVIDFTPEQLEQKMAYYANSCYLKIPGLCTGAFDEIEHVKPIAKGGAHMIANVRPACLPCNRHKFNKWPFKAAS